MASRSTSAADFCAASAVQRARASSRSWLRASTASVWASRCCPIVESSCGAARDYSRAYLHHLVKSGEILGMMLLTWANLAYYQHLMAGMREAIAAGCFAEFAARTKADWAQGDVAAL